MRQPPRSGRRARLVPKLLAAASIASLGCAWASPSVSAAPASTPTSSQGASGASITLTQQTSWVAAGQPLVLHLSVRSSQPASALEMSAAVFPRLSSGGRSSFIRTLQGHLEGPELGRIGPELLRQIPSDAEGLALQIPTDGSGAIPDLSTCSDCGDGVYPVRVELSNATTGALDAEFVTHLVYYTSARPPELKLRFSWVLPVYAPPAASSSGDQRLSPTWSAALSGLAATLSEFPTVPVTLAANPETVQGLASSGRLRDQATVAQLAHLAAGASHPLLPATYVPVDLSEIAAAGLGEEVGQQVSRADQVLDTTLGPKRLTGTWAATGSLDPQAADLLAAQGVTRVVVPDQDLLPPSGNQTPTSPFTLETKGAYSPEAVMADSTLASHFTNDSDPVLAAHQLLADLAMLYFQAPSVPSRAAVVESPFGWVPNQQFLSTVLSSLSGSQSPFVTPTTLDAVFALGTGHNEGSLENGASAPGLDGGNIRADRARLTSFESAVGPANPAVETMNDLLLVSQSSQLRTQARHSYLDGFGRSMAAQTAMLSLPPDRSITLTSRTGRIPVTIVSTAPYPVHAVLEVASEKLAFPYGSSELLTLDKRNSVEYFDVSARTAGDFPLRIALVSPRGSFVLLRGHLTVRSTAASWVGIALSVGAGAFLLVWWAISWRRGRRNRNRRLVPNPR